MNLAKWIRPEVRGFEPYLPGKPIGEVRRELGLKRIVKLASNENALGSSPQAVRAAARSAASSFRYPEGPGTLLRQALAKKLGVREAEVTLGAGSDELIEIFAKTFLRPQDQIVVSEHAFIRYKMAGDLMGCRVVSVPMREEKHDLEAMAEAVTPRTKAVFIANPNNPTGTYVSLEEVRLFLSRVGGKGRLPFVIFDEAYCEFARRLAPDYPESVDFFSEGYNVLVFRTFSKIYGLAGLRVGYGIAHRSVVEQMDRVRPPFNVSTVAQAAALAALKDSGHVERSARLVERELKELCKGLEGLGLSYTPSVGNFVLADVRPWRGRDLFRKLLAKGVIVRAMEEYGFPSRVRITVGKPEENRFLIRQLKEVLGKR